MRGQTTNTNQTKNHKAKAKQNPHKQTKNKTKHKTKTARSVISWSVHSHLKRIRRDDNIASPLGLVWQNKTRANNKSRKCHTAICEPGSNKSTMSRNSNGCMDVLLVQCFCLRAYLESCVGVVSNFSRSRWTFITFYTVISHTG